MNEYVKIADVFLEELSARIDIKTVCNLRGAGVVRSKYKNKKNYLIDPVSKPRQTQSDKWKKRPAAMRYRAFKDHVRELDIEIPAAGSHIIFYMPIPKSWSKKKQTEMEGKPHRQTPDLDNLLKAIFDAVHKDDCFIYDCRATKIWAYQGSITISI